MAPINLPDGSQVSEIVLPDGSTASEVLAPDGSTVFGNAIPDGVLYQARVEEFADPWPFNVGGIDMTVSGLTESTFSNGEPSVSGDGSDDGLADGPQEIMTNESWGIALTTAYDNPGANDTWTGVDNGARLQIWNDENVTTKGCVAAILEDDSGNRLRVATDSAFDDGTPKAVVVNKTGDSASDINIYVEDMETARSQTNFTDNSYDHTNVTADGSMGFWGTYDGSGFVERIAADCGVFEFWNDPLTQSDREDFVSRRPEV